MFGFGKKETSLRLSDELLPSSIKHFKNASSTFSTTEEEIIEYMHGKEQLRRRLNIFSVSMSDKERLAATLEYREFCGEKTE